tara:strand:+ start:2098 stop:3078 length:981 start_codon:yes stop_codon:yes gene_type:complete
MNIIVLGAGTFGTAIANELSVNSNNHVILFSRDKNKVEEINKNHTNKVCFPNKRLTESLRASCNNQDIKKASIVFIALPSKVILETLNSINDYLSKDALLVNLSKGMLRGGVIIVDAIKDTLKTDNIVTLKGPSFAVEVMEHADTLLTLGYKERFQYDIIKSIISNTSLYIDSTKDIRGVELLSILKNIYALVLGVVDAKYDSPNTRFMILTKVFSEIKVFLGILEGNENTLFLACGFGDLCLTSLNDLSRNRTLGLLIGKGFFNSDYKSNDMIIEGLNSIKMLRSLLNDSQMDSLPIFSKLFLYFTNPEENNIDFYYTEFIDYNL